MLPIGDINPTSRRAFFTFAILAACVVIFFGYQVQAEAEQVATPAGTVNVPAQLSFTLRWAAVPCEIIQGDPLTVAEAVRTFRDGDQEACVTGDRGPSVYPEKNVYLAILVSMFMHGSLLHLGSNMLFLWIFGNNIEDRLGHIRYLAFYLVGGFVATMAHVFVQPQSTVPLVGASGAIAAVMGAYLVWFPNAPVRALVFFFIPAYIRAKWFLGFWFIAQFFTQPDAAVAWVAHVGGFVFGVVIGVIVRLNHAAADHMFRQQYRSAGPWDPTGGWGR